MIDLRSDTVTRPTPGMLDAMMSAAVGDDVYGEDPTVQTLQRRAADMFGMEAALFCPSGTMSNQIGIRLHTRPGDEVICSALAHIYLYEVGGLAANCGVSAKLLAAADGRFNVSAVQAAINDRDDVHLPWSRLVAIENTVNKGGGCCWSMDQLQQIRRVCDKHGLAFHLDGARLFNALVATGQAAQQHGAIFDTISICLSKGLGAPVGSLLLGSGDAIRQATRMRKLMGGGMRQAGYLAAAGLYALDHHVERLAVDHVHASEVEKALRDVSYVSNIRAVETNIVIFELPEQIPAASYLAHLSSQGILADTMGHQAIRFVFHLDVPAAAVDQVIEVVRRFSP